MADSEPVEDPVSNMDTDELSIVCEVPIERVVACVEDVSSCWDSKGVDCNWDVSGEDVETACEADVDSIRVSEEERDDWEIPEDDTTSIDCEEAVCSTVAEESKVWELAEELISVIVELPEWKKVVVEFVDVIDGIGCAVSEAETEIMEDPLPLSMNWELLYEDVGIDCGVVSEPWVVDLEAPGEISDAVELVGISCEKPEEDWDVVLDPRDGVPKVGLVMVCWKNDEEAIGINCELPEDTCAVLIEEDDGRVRDWFEALIQTVWVSELTEMVDCVLEVTNRGIDVVCWLSEALIQAVWVSELTEMVACVSEVPSDGTDVVCWLSEVWEGIVELTTVGRLPEVTTMVDVDTSCWLVETWEVDA